MSFFNRNITILILVASIISAFALNILAASSVIEDFNYTDEYCTLGYPRGEK